MFDELYKTEYWRRRQAEGPLSAEREAYLEQFASRGDARSTLARVAGQILLIARQVAKWPRNHLFTQEDLQRIAELCTQDPQRGAWRKDSPESRHMATNWARGFIGFLGRLAPVALPAKAKYAAQIEDFIRDHHVARGASPHTIKQARTIVTRFLGFFENKRRPLAKLAPENVDAFMHFMGQRWSRRSMGHLGHNLRSWLTYCELRGWIRKGVAKSVLTPRRYTHEGLPVGPTWDEVASVVRNLNDRIQKLLRDRAIILLLSVYGLRSSEVCALQEKDLDWERSTIRIRSSKSSRETITSLEPNVAEAILAYSQYGRPKSSRPEIFHRLDSPIGPLTRGAVGDLVREHSTRVLGAERAWHPHALRHACARHLLSSGFTLHRISDHLVHSSVRSTTVYAKVDLDALRKVAFEDLGDLA